jgi:hypothetical protein
MGADKFGDKEHVLNYTSQRFQLTRPRAVGPTMELIRKCNPTSLLAWENFYWENAYTARNESVKITQEVIDGLGLKLYDKIQKVIIPEWNNAFNTITKEDCVNYILDVTINRSFDGFHRENAVTRELGVIFSKEIFFEETDSVTDSAWGIDWLGNIIDKDVKIGIQVKPATSRATAIGGFSVEDRGNARWTEFQEKFGGPVFVVYSKKTGKKNTILNREVIDDIRKFLNSL